MNKGRKYVLEEFKNHLEFMPGFHNLLARVQIKHKTGLVTASPKHNIDWLCEMIHLDKIFSHIISGSEITRNKPYPDPYFSMMKLLNVLPENTVIIEDSLHGLRSALDSGAHVIAKTGSVPKEDLSIAHLIVSHLDEITDGLINQLLREKI